MKCWQKKKLSWRQTKKAMMKKWYEEWETKSKKNRKTNGVEQKKSWRENEETRSQKEKKKEGSAGRFLLTETKLT